MQPANPNRRRFIGGAVGGALGATGLSGCERSAAPQTIRHALDNFSGRVIERSAPSYEKWRQSMTWQMRKPTRFPELILRPENREDVQRAMRFASDRDLKVAVRSGGHHVWSGFLRDGGVLLDMSRFKSCQVGSGYADVGPSLWARDLIARLAQPGYAFPVAHCASVPLGGYLLGGGLGLNGDEWDGIACAGILGAELVTPDGEYTTADEISSELLWAVRGGGNGVPGVVTNLRVKGYPRPAGVVTATYVFPLAALDEATTLLQALVAAAPSNTEMLALMTHNPQAPPDAPPGIRKMIVVRAQVYANDESAADPLVGLLSGHVAAKASVFNIPSQPDSFESLFVGSMDWRRGFGFGRFGVENAWVDTMRDALQTIAPIYAEAPSWKSHVVIQPKLKTMAADSGAFSVSGNTYIGVYSVWDEAAKDTDNISWLRKMTAALDQHAVGHYINEIDSEHEPDRIQRSYSPDAWRRLRALRNQLDPNSVMHDFPGL